jgi:Type II secretion system (T2SS), protein G
VWRAWLQHPWRAFWLAVLAWYVLIFAGALTESQFFLRVPGTIVIGTVLFAMAASAVWGVCLSWRRSRRRAILYIGLPVLVLVIVMGGGAAMREHMVGRARHANASADARALGDAVTKYAAHMGRLPGALTDLTAPVMNDKGEAAGPFLARLPTPPSLWTPYRYEPHPTGTFSITSEGEGRTVAFPAK